MPENKFIVQWAGPIFIYRNTMGKLALKISQKQLWPSSEGGKLLLLISILWPIWTKGMPTKELTSLFQHHEQNQAAFSN